MFGDLKKFWFERRIRQLISSAMRTLYSEEFDFSALVARLAVPNDHIHLLRAFVAIRVAAELSEPLTEADVAQVARELSLLEPHHDKEGFQELMEIFRQMAEVQWMRGETRILRGHVAHQEDEDSYEGLLYIGERNSSGPVTHEQRELAAKIGDLTRQIREEELKAWKEQDQVEYERLKDEIEARKLRNEVEKHEELEEKLEFDAIKSMLDAKIKRLTRDWTNETGGTSQARVGRGVNIDFAVPQDRRAMILSHIPDHANHGR